MAQCFIIRLIRALCVRVEHAQRAIYELLIFLEQTYIAHGFSVRVLNVTTCILIFKYMQIHQFNFDSSTPSPPRLTRVYGKLLCMYMLIVWMHSHTLCAWMHSRTQTPHLHTHADTHTKTLTPLLLSKEHWQEPRGHTRPAHARVLLIRDRDTKPAMFHEQPSRPTV